VTGTWDLEGSTDDQISIEAVERDMDGDDRTLGDATAHSANGRANQ
jgi:hypothetical protein